MPVSDFFGFDISDALPGAAQLLFCLVGFTVLVQNDGRVCGQAWNKDKVDVIPSEMARGVVGISVAH